MNDELRAKDIYKTLPPRTVVGARLVERVGARAWKAPSFGPGRSLFGRCGLPDPWDPAVEQVEVGLGDVGLKDDRRQPAPHAAPPAPSGPAGSKLPNVPAATPNPTADARGRPAPQIGTTRRVEAGELKPKTDSVTTRPKAPPKREHSPSAFGGGPIHHPVAKLPVRPNFAAADPPVATAVIPAPMHLGKGVGMPPAPSAAAAQRTAPAPPVVVPSPAPPAPNTPPAKPPPATVNRRPPSGGGGGLDDLFGMGGGDNTRIKLNRTPAEGEPPKPRRQVVSSPEALAQGGVDRRPPPPKLSAPAPGVAPAAIPSVPRPEDDMPDE